jgi:putative inorganic carbon (hco3(-)) transporter
LFAEQGTRPPSSPSRASVLAAQVAVVTVLAGVVLRLVVDTFGPGAAVAAVVGLVLLAVAVAGWMALPEDSRLRRWTAGLALAVAAAAVGLVLAAVGGVAGPLAMVLLPAALIASATVLIRPVVAVVLVLLVIPVGLAELPGAPLGLQVMQVTALVAVSVAVLGRALNGQAPVDLPGPMVWAVLLLPWGLLSTLGGVSLDLAVRQMAALTVNIALALLALTLVTSIETLRRLLWLLLAVAAGVCVFALLGGGDLRSAYGGAQVSGRLTGTFTQPNQFGSFTMVAALIGSGLVLAARAGAERTLALLALIPVVLGLLLSLSRSSWLGLLGGLAVMVLLLPAARRTLLAAGVPLILVGLALGAFAPENPQVRVVGERVTTFAETGGGNPYDDRPRIWAEGRREVALSPVTGHGPGSFPLVSTRATSQASTVQAEHAHNVLLTVAAEYGLPGAALLVGLAVHVGLFVLSVLKRAGPVSRPLLVGLAAACVGIAVQGLLDYTMRNAVLFTFFWLVAGLTVAAGRAVGQEQDVPARR